LRMISNVVKLNKNLEEVPKNTRDRVSHSACEGRSLAKGKIALVPSIITASI